MRTYVNLKSRKGTVSIYVFQDELAKHAASVKARLVGRKNVVPEDVARGDLLAQAERRRAYVSLLSDSNWVEQASQNDLLFAKQQAAVALPGEVPEKIVAQDQMPQRSRAILGRLF